MGWILGAWLITVILMAVLAAITGRMTSGSAWGIFVDSRDTWSLTQFQLVLWTFVIVPVLVAIVIGRAVQDPATAWDITVPTEVWGVLGISFGSNALANAVKSQKNSPEQTPLAAGNRILTRRKATEAKFSDIFAYDEGAAALANLDVTKFQNFVFTVALAVIYLWNCGWLIRPGQTPSHLTALPGFSGVALGLLGISHAAYLTGKVIPQNGSPKAADDGATELATVKFQSQPPAASAAEAPSATTDLSSSVPSPRVTAITLHVAQDGADNGNGQDGGQLQEAATTAR